MCIRDSSTTCTPTSVSCGTEGLLSQQFTDNSLCGYTWSTTAWSSSTNTCTTNETVTRSVTCQQSDGTVVASSYCADAGTQPAASESISDYSGCGTATFSTNTVSCAATGAGVGSTNCSPDSVTITAVGGPVTLAGLTQTDSTDFNLGHD